MPTDLDNLLTARAALYAQLAAGNCRPDYTIDGQAVSWGAFETALKTRIQVINEQIALADVWLEIPVQGCP